MPVLFLSDLHLSPQRPAQIALFKQFLAGPARRAEAVYILGDLFEEFWLGDDDHTPPAEEIMTHLKSCAAHNPNLFFLRGNRDLMVGDDFTRRSGCRLLADETVIQVNQQAILLLHGDLLCTHDLSYQRFRAFMERPVIRKLFLGLPYIIRKLLARGLRPLMRRDSARKQAAIIDVNEAAVVAAMQRHRVSVLIHGHTHRPAIHQLQVQGQPAQRIVLGDWYQNELILVCDGQQKKLLRVQELQAASA
ncbi:MAG: UDP-2,3-diacylglucosamine diphosphatase [Gammaproteobacteria bacterium]